MAASNFPDAAVAGCSRNRLEHAGLLPIPPKRRGSECAEKLARKAWELRNGNSGFRNACRFPETIMRRPQRRGEAELVLISDTGDESVYGGAGRRQRRAHCRRCWKQGFERERRWCRWWIRPPWRRRVRSGIGRQITLRLGGRVSGGSMPSLQITGLVKAIAGAWRPHVFGDGRVTRAERSVLFESGHLKIADCWNIGIMYRVNPPHSLREARSGRGQRQDGGAQDRG